jgi:uncharacterized membrane protein YjjB (DUF3815 family)
MKFQGNFNKSTRADIACFIGAILFGILAEILARFL